MADDEIWDKAEQGKPKPFTIVGDERPLLFRAAPMPDPEDIAPRPWLYGTQLLRGYLSILSAAGGTGKSAYAMGVGLSLASGRALFGEKVYQRVNVAILNLEDPLDEMNRRLAALMIHHKVKRADVDGRLFLYSGDERPITIAAMSQDGFEIVHPDQAAIIREIQQHDIGLLIVDPFAESHELEENSNSDMNKAAAAWRKIARVCSCSVTLIHHVRKGAGRDTDSMRGAKALSDAARVGLVMSSMSEEEAGQFDITPEDRPSFVRLDDAKANMSQRAGVARWFKLETIELGNVTKDYPNGDRVAAIARWNPPSLMGELTVLQCNEILDEIDRGPREGARYSSNRAGKTGRWAGQILIEHYGVGEKRAASILAVWIKEGLLEQQEYVDERRHKVSGLSVNAGKRPGTRL